MLSFRNRATAPRDRAFQAAPGVHDLRAHRPGPAAAGRLAGVLAEERLAGMLIAGPPPLGTRLMARAYAVVGFGRAAEKRASGCAIDGPIWPESAGLHRLGALGRGGFEPCESPGQAWRGSCAFSRVTGAAPRFGGLNSSAMPPVNPLGRVTRV